MPEVNKKKDRKAQRAREAYCDINGIEPEMTGPKKKGQASASDVDIELFDEDAELSPLGKLIAKELANEEPDTKPSTSPEKESDKPSCIKLFEHYGMIFGAPNASNEVLAEECPKCGGDKFYLNVKTSKFHCKKDDCNYKGNALTFARGVYNSFLGKRTNDSLRALKDKRGWSLQLIKDHGIVYDPHHKVYLIPAFSEKGKLIGLQEYNAKTGSKCNIPGLKQQIYGRDKLSNNGNKILIALESSYDYISMDGYLTKRIIRSRYDLLGIPSARVFKQNWVKFFKGRKKLRLCFDNDPSGKEGQDRVAKILKDAGVKIEVAAMCWPADMPAKSDIGDLIRDRPEVNVIEFTEKNCVKVSENRKIKLTWGDDIEDGP